MSLGFSKFGLSLALVGFAASNLLVTSALAQGKPQTRRSIELSETNSAEILTNLNQLTIKKDEFRQLDDRLRMLKDLSAPKSMEQRFAVPYATPSAVPNKKMRELLERQKNWALAPEDLNLSTSSSDSDVSAFEGTDKLGGKKSSLQQFYDALSHSGSGAPNSDRSAANRSSASNKRSISSPQNDSEDDSGLPPEIRDKTKRIKDMVNEDPSSIFNPTRPHSNFDNFFGRNETPSVTEQSTGHKTSVDSFLDQYKKGLDPSVAAGLDPALSTLVPASSSQQKTFSPELTKLPTAMVHQDKSDPTPPGKVSSVLDVTSVSDINAAALNQWNPLYTQHKLELPKISPPSPPNLDFPRRKFQ